MASTESTPKIRLTQTVKKGGCAAKLPAGQLRAVLSNLKLKRAPELLVGTETLDDAALWDLGDGRLLVQTLDFFTPIVDDARDFGAIAAANAISDVYAMGGTPATALTIMAFPMAHLPAEMIGELMDGACEKIEEAGASLAGGHTIDDDTLKLGFSITGFVPKNSAWTNTGAKVGDTLILTKALGTGTITTAIKSGDATAESAEAAILSMKLLNRCRDLIEGFEIHAATDVTGFALAGHAMQMAQASHVHFEIDLSRLPVLPGALKLLEEEFTNRAHVTNQAYTEGKVRYAPGASAAQIWLTLDPQTSGGLLLSVKPEDADHIISALRSRFPATSVIGSVLKESSDSFWIDFK